MAVKKNATSLYPPPFFQEYQDPWNTLHIDLDALAANWHWLRSKIPKNQPMFAVLKADAYGHGLSETAMVLNEIGCRHFAVESPQEGIILRQAGIEDEILLINPIPDWMAEQAVRYDLSVSVIHESILTPLEESAAALDRRCRIHVNMNLGLNRMGMPRKKIPALAEKISSLPHLQLMGLFGQPRDLKTAGEALERLNASVYELKSRGIDIPQVHFANSISFLHLPEARNLGVRLGILLYGVMPPEEASNHQRYPMLKPVMSLTTKVVQIQRLTAGSRLGYHSQEKITRDSIIAVLPLGYYHGLARRMKKGGNVLIHGEKAPFKGNISMNASMVDISDIPDVHIGDEAVLFGAQNGHCIEMNDLAVQTETIAAELMMRFGSSISRRYHIKENEVETKISIRKKEEQFDIHYIQTVKDIPDNIHFSDLVEFLNVHMKPFHDPESKISAALDYALASSAPGQGFVLLAFSKNRILGVLVNIKTNTGGFIPGNIIVYLCVRKSLRQKGLGKKLVQEAIKCTEGEIKLHVKKNNPAISFYKKLGFNLSYVEMRFKGDH